MESPPPLIPAPAMVEQGKPVVVRPPEVGSAHDFAVIGYIITFLLSIPWILLSLIIGGIGVAAYLGYVILPPVLPSPWCCSIPFLSQFLAFMFALLTPSFVVYTVLGAGGLLLALLFLGAIYFGLVRNISKGRYEKARNAALFFGVLFIIPAFFVLYSALLSGLIIALVPAFFFLLAYGRLGEVIAKYGPVAVMGEAVPGMPGVAPPMPVTPGAMSIGGPMPVTPGAMSIGGPMPTVPGGPMPPPMAGAPSPRNPQCPTCGKELYYAANHRRWYCQTCDK
jgi:hypothetical protein